MGENGAGKSSLMNVLYGLYHPDEGEIVLDGKPVRFKSPQDAVAAGIGMVHQHFMLVRPRSPSSRTWSSAASPSAGDGWIWGRAWHCEVSATCERFGREFHLEFDPAARVDTLTVGSQQKVEIVKALHRGAKVLILDEPTAVLTPQESDDLFRIAQGLRDEGNKRVVLVTHKLREIGLVTDASP